MKNRNWIVVGLLGVGACGIAGLAVAADRAWCHFFGDYLEGWVTA